MTPRIVTSLVMLTMLALPASLHALVSGHQCNSCHQIHGAASPQLLKKAVVETICLACHGAAGTSTLKADVHKNKTRSSYPAFRITCTGCHDPHSNMPNWTGGANIKLVGTDKYGTPSSFAKISTTNSGVRNVVFESRGTGVGQPALHSFADSDRDGNGIYDGVCEVCHTRTSHHRNNAADTTHKTGNTCTSCHTHVKNFNR